MCLKSITRVIENPTLDELVGFKVVSVIGERIVPPYYKSDGDSRELFEYSLPTNEWLVSVSKEQLTEDSLYEDTLFKYNTGFHIFTTLDGAQTWHHATHVIQVKYRLVTYHGTEHRDQSVHIAREMYIPWPQVPVRIE